MVLGGGIDTNCGKAVELAATVDATFNDTSTGHEQYVGEPRNWHVGCKSQPQNRFLCNGEMEV